MISAATHFTSLKGSQIESITHTLSRILNCIFHLVLMWSHPVLCKDDADKGWNYTVNMAKCDYHSDRQCGTDLSHRYSLNQHCTQCVTLPRSRLLCMPVHWNNISIISITTFLQRYSLVGSRNWHLTAIRTLPWQVTCSFFSFHWRSSNSSKSSLELSYSVNIIASLLHWSLHRGYENANNSGLHLCN